MDDRDIREVHVGGRIVVFDGRVLEVFNGHEGSQRVHVAQMSLKLSETRKGRLYVELTSKRRNTPREIFEVEPADRPRFEALMAEVQAASAAGEHEVS